MGDTQTVTIRRMLPADVAAVAGLTVQLGYPSSEADIKRRYELIKDRWDTRLLVAQHAEHAVVGWVHVQVTYLLESDPRAEIWGLVVAEGARKTGVGRRLMEAAEEWAVHLGVDVMVVRSNYMRLEAQAFYERLGYTLTKTQNSFRKALN
jgi:ribosomal protein S18 acetylase RimI-like enzyme